MKKFLIVLMFGFFTIFFSFGQTVFISPQTINWDEPSNIPSVGITEYEIFLIKIFDGTKVQVDTRNNNDKYILLGKVNNLLVVVDLQAIGLQGDFVIAIRTVYTYNDVISISDFAYSDVDADVFPIGETFYLRYLGGAINGVNKPTMIRFNGGA